MNNIYLYLNIVGLALDLLGFICIYLAKYRNIRTIRPSSVTYRIKKISDLTIERASEEIMETVNKYFDRLYKEFEDFDKKTNKYFIIVIIGVVLQITSVIVYFCQNLF